MNAYRWRDGLCSCENNPLTRRVGCVTVKPTLATNTIMLRSSYQLVPFVRPGRVNGVGAVEDYGEQFDPENPDYYGQTQAEATQWPPPLTDPNAGAVPITSTATKTTSPASANTGGFWAGITSTFGKLASNIVEGSTPTVLSKITGQPVVQTGPGSAVAAPAVAKASILGGSAGLLIVAGIAALVLLRKR